MFRRINHFYEFGPFRVDISERVLQRNGEIVPLTPTLFDLLLVLVEKSGHLLDKDDLMQRLWPDSFVEEGNLARNVSRLRAALGESRHEHPYIETVARRGYRFVADVREVRDDCDPVSVDSTRSTAYASDEELPEKAIKSVSSIPKPSAEPAWRHFIAKIRNHRKTALTLSTALLSAAVVIASAAYLHSVREAASSKPAESSGKLTISHFSRGGNIRAAGISPNGKYVAYSVVDGVQRSSLWVRHLPTMTSTQIIPEADVVYHDLSFSPHGDYIYYVQKNNQLQLFSLYQVPLLGGVSKKLLDDVDSRVSFSPDGSRIVFRRQLLARRESALIIANADGAAEQQIASVKQPETFGRPAWSPDGKVIACSAGHTDGGSNEYLVEITVKNGTLRKISERKWYRARDVAWVADGSGLLMLAGEHDATPLQVWRLSYPGGKPRPITDTHKGFNKLSVSSASRTMLLNESALVTSVWLVPFEDPSRARQITPVAGGYGGGLSWTPDGKIVHQSLDLGVHNLSVMDADGSNQRPLLLDRPPRGHAIQPSVSSDGRYILFAADFTGARHIWRMDSDGRNPVQLTHGKGEDHPTSSPDGRWVIYTDIGSDRPTLWKVPMTGGAPIQITQVFSNAPDVSPDGKLIACYTSDERPGSFWQIGIFDFARGEPVKIFANPMRHGAPVRWTPDGRALTYADSRKGFVNVWLQPLAGGEPKQLTDFEGDGIFAFSWSRDGKYLSCVRGTWAIDLALITNFE
jgi:eukaryotic-like serine/threonine-protein kinase